MDLPLACSLSLQNIKSEEVEILGFDFKLKVTGKPKVLQLFGGQHIYFDLMDFEIVDYIDTLPGDVIDRYMVSRLLAVAKKVLP